MSFPLRHQPVKGVYVTGRTLALLFFELPYWSIKYSVPSLRPSPSWSLGRSVMVNAMKVFIEMKYQAGFGFGPEDHKIDFMTSEAAQKGCVQIDAAPEALVGKIGRMAKVNRVEALPVVGFWISPNESVKMIPETKPVGPDDKVVMHLHGGGFVMGTADPHKEGLLKAFYAELLASLSTPARVFAPEYRISSGAPFQPLNPFPAALIDTVASYKYLVQTCGYRPQNVIVSGDSAGGALAEWLIRFLSIHGSSIGLPMPGGAVLLSPTVDFYNTRTGPDSSMALNVATDFVEPILKSGYTKRALLGNLGEDDQAAEAWIAASSMNIRHAPGTFKEFPSTFIMVGKAEQTYDPVPVLRDLLVRDIGKDKVEYVEMPHATHDPLVTPAQPERADGFSAVGTFIDKVWGSK